MKPNDKIKTLSVRNTLLSTGEFTVEAIIRNDGKEYYESAPLGLTVGLKETQDKIHVPNLDSILNLQRNITTLTQEEFDYEISKVFDSQTTSAFSLAYTKLQAYRKGFSEKELFDYFSSNYSGELSPPKVICNILNGGKHAQNELTFCEFMIIPKGSTPQENIEIASQVYRDLETTLVNEMGENQLFLGREGGFAPQLSNVDDALSLLNKAISYQNKDKCSIAIDVAANNFSKEIERGIFEYQIDKNIYTTDALVEYYISLLDEHPNINYLEDPLHEDDINGWKQLYKKLGDKILIVADDLTVSKLKNIKSHRGLFNGCVLKINQAGTFTELIKSYNYCLKNNIRTIVSQRSGETDSNIISHIAVGLGSDYLKAGAPARERIVKYNELLRIT